MRSLINDAEQKNEITFIDYSDRLICSFIGKLRQRYGPLDPDVNEEYRQFLIDEGILKGGEA